MERALTSLSPRTRWLARQLEVLASVDSTNRLAEDRAEAGAPDGTAILADTQTAGRGRLGRSFFSPPDAGLYLSVVLRPHPEPDRVHEHVFVAATAVAEAAAAALGGAGDIEIKWPNDVLLDGRKTSGINLPTRVEHGRVRWAVLGIGVNVNTARDGFPPELREVATSLRLARGARVDRAAFAEDLLERLERELDEYRGSGFGQVLDHWRKFFRMPGNRVRVGGPGVDREVEGRVEGVGADGALLLQTPDGVERVLAGDVTVLARNGGAGGRAGAARH